MSGDHPHPSTSWGHRLRQENRRLREKVLELQKEITGLKKRLQSTWGLLEHVPGGLMVVQREKILFVNEDVCRAFGYARNDVLSMAASDLLGPDWGKVAIPLPKARAADPSPSHPTEIALKTRTGEPLYALIRANKALYQGKTTFLLYLLTFDPTEWEKRRNRESGKGEALIRMAAGFRHELDLYRTLLPNPIPWKHHADALEGNGRRRLRGINAIREKETLLRQHLGCLTRTEYDPHELTVLDLRKVIQTAVDIAHPRSFSGPPHPVTIKTFLRAPCRVYGCAEELRDVFVNMILNAVEAIPDGGDIYLTAESHSGMAHIYIQDTGEGIPASVADKIFDPFFTTKEGHGRGLGLSLAHAIVARHQGEIRVSSREGRGSTFMVRLPLAREISLSITTAPKKVLKDAHILIFGNEGILIDLLHALLTGKGWLVTTAFSYTEALKTLRETPVDLMVIDQSVSPSDVFEIARRTKKKWPNLPLAITNAKKPLPLKSRRATAADLILGRPLDMEGFLIRASELLKDGVTFK